MDLFEKADIPGGGALYTVNDLLSNKVVGANAKGRYAERDYLVDYLECEKKFKEFDGAPDDVTPFYFLREQNTKLFLNKFYTSKNYSADADIVSLLTPETVSLNPKDRHLQKQVLGEYGRMPKKPDAILTRRCLEERMSEVAASHNLKLSAEEMNRYIHVGEEINKVYYANKRIQGITESADKAAARFGKSDIPDEQNYYHIRFTHLQERLERHQESHNISMRDDSYKAFMQEGSLDPFSKSILKKRLSEEYHDILGPDMGGTDPVIKALRKAATVQICNPSLLLEGQVEKAKERIAKACSDFISVTEKLTGKKLPKLLIETLEKAEGGQGNQVIAQFLRPTEDAAKIIPPMVLMKVVPLAYSNFMNGYTKEALKLPVVEVKEGTQWYQRETSKSKVATEIV